MWFGGIETQRILGKKGIRRALLGGVCTFAAMPTFIAAPGEAQAAPIGELVVTARKRAESVQSIPVAVTAFSASLLRDLAVDDLEDLGSSVPNMNLVQGRGSSSSANIFIRGMGQPDALQTFDPGVGVYLDGVYVSRIQGSLFKLFDVERLEVLRGPQGTLYGKNTIGGAVKIITRKPGDEFEGNFEVGFGEYDRREAKAYLSGPLIEGKLAASVSGIYAKRDGFVTDPVTGEEYNDDDTLTGRVNLVATPNDSLEIGLSADFTRQRTALTLGKAEAPLFTADLVIPGVTFVHTPSPNEFDFKTRTSFSNGEGQDLDSMGVALNIDWDISDTLTISSITAYRDLDLDFYIDIDATEFELGDVRVPIKQDQLSQEFQFKVSQDRWDGVFGLYYLKENNKSDQRAFADDLLTIAGAPATVLTSVADDLETTSYAAFAHLDFRATEQLSIAAGLRYSYEKKEYEYDRVARLNGAVFATHSFTDDESWDALTPSLSVEYAWTDDLMTYASVSRGFKSGGFNGRATSGPESKPYDPETVWTYEVGLKSTWADGRVTANVTAFFNEYEDFQARVSEVVDPSAPVLVFALPVLNAAKLETSGLEVEIAASPTDNLNLFATVGYLDAEYVEFTDALVDRSSDIPPFAPEWTARLGGVYTIDLPGDAGSVKIGADANFKSDHHLSVDNQDVLTQDDFWLYNAFLRYEAPDERWYVGATFKNISDEVYKTDAQEFSSVANIQTAYYGDPQTWMITAGFKF